MEDIVSSQTKPSFAPEPPPSDLEARRARRQAEYLARALAEPDPKAAVIGSSVAELLEFLPMLKTATIEAAAAAADPVERLAKLTKGVQTSAAVCRLGQALS